jgi:Flp pilus assembly pilin Flp
MHGDREGTRTRDERGANLVEYVLLLALIAVIVLSAVKAFGSTTSTRWSSTDSVIAEW